MKLKKQLYKKQLAGAILGLRVETLWPKDRLSMHINSLGEHLDESSERLGLLVKEKADFTLKDKRWIRPIISKKLSLEDIL